MALIQSQQVSLAGTALTFAAVNSSDTFTADDDLVLYVKNGGGSSITVTLVDASRTPAGSAATNPTVSVPNGQERPIGPIPAAMANTATGLITVTYSATASVTAALMRV